MTEQQLELLKRYNAALKLYKERQWKAAIDAFKKALEIDPNDGPSRLYIQRSEEYMVHPPEDDWDGVFVMKTK
ncbi:MAG: tetratricopeptide repeat protein [Leptospiraceae bacterium]|nr:tetratricopeptide repeat protein [Leptospiraceae bacterium]MCB1303369.1 tetratricopeptide repeat protein [Leptospiraceae bacterium]